MFAAKSPIITLWTLFVAVESVLREMRQLPYLPQIEKGIRISAETYVGFSRNARKDQH
jgi:hypothetical protein